jgi:hypothetical protein
MEPHFDYIIWAYDENSRWVVDSIDNADNPDKMILIPIYTSKRLLRGSKYFASALASELASERNEHTSEFHSRVIQSILTIESIISISKYEAQTDEQLLSCAAYTDKIRMSNAEMVIFDIISTDFLEILRAVDYYGFDCLFRLIIKCVAYEVHCFIHRDTQLELTCETLVTALNYMPAMFVDPILQEYLDYRTKMRKDLLRFPDLITLLTSGKTPSTLLNVVNYIFAHGGKIPYSLLQAIAPKQIVLLKKPITFEEDLCHLSIFLNGISISIGWQDGPFKNIIANMYKEIVTALGVTSGRLYSLIGDEESFNIFDQDGSDPNDSDQESVEADPIDD